MLNKNLIKILIITISIMVLLSGCNEQSSDEENESNDSENEHNLPSIQSFIADKNEINEGETVNLSWSIINSTTASINPSIGAISSQGSLEITVNESITYTLIAENKDGNVTESINIIVYSGGMDETPIIHFSEGYQENYLLVTYISDNISWENIQLNGRDLTEEDIDRSSGMDTVQKGDRLINLTGSVTLTWKPTNQSLGHWDFT
ncbi:MAG TPA: hypothetical protein VKP59_06675 [Candidatus Thermoplasmatota archaeon]|nr:hypothetical protein [Candidatus Thermoplasmatota archaeon]